MTNQINQQEVDNHVTEAWRVGYNINSDFRRRVNAAIIKDLTTPPAGRLAEQTLVDKLQKTIELKLAVSEHFAQSEKTGLGKYGPDFVGDPLTHAQMELRDTLLYLYTRLYSLSPEEIKSVDWHELNITIALARQAFHRVTNLIQSAKKNQ